MPRWRKNLCVLFVAQLISIVGFSVIFPFLSLYVAELGATFGSTEFWAAMVFSGPALTMTIAAPMWGSLADRFGRKMMLQRAMLGGGVLLGLMAMVRSAAQLAVLPTVQGVPGTVFGA